MLYSSLAKDEVYRTLLTLGLYVTGIRIGLLQGKFDFPQYFGFLLSNLSVLSLFTSFRTFFIQVFAFFLLFGLFVFSFILNSKFGIILNLINSSIFLSLFTAKDSKSAIFNFFGFFIIDIVIFIVKGSDMNIYFEVIEYSLKNILPLNLGNTLNSLKASQLIGVLPEKELATQLLKTFERFLVG